MSQDWSCSPVIRAAWFPVKQPWHGLAHGIQSWTARLNRASQEHHPIFPEVPSVLALSHVAEALPAPHTFTHVGLSCRAVQTQASNACPMPSPHFTGSLAQECSSGWQLPSEQALDKGSVLVFLLLFIAHTWGMLARAWAWRTWQFPRFRAALQEPSAPGGEERQRRGFHKFFRSQIT